MLVAVLLKDKGDFFKDDKTHLAASTHGKDLSDVGVTAVLAAFNVVDVDDGLGVDKQRLALAFATRLTHAQTRRVLCCCRGELARTTTAEE